MLDERYIKERDGTYYVRGHRIPLKVLMYLWNNGESPEAMRQSLDTLTLVEVYGPILFYLEHREMLDRHFAQVQAEEDRLIAEMRARPSPLREEILRRHAALKAQEKAAE
jgi:uncharacterized protein (DUF433 family)